MTRKRKMTDTTKTYNDVLEADMAGVSGATFTAHSFKGDLLNTPSAVAALTGDNKPANTSRPTVLQQIEMYCRIKRARGEKPF